MVPDPDADPERSPASDAGPPDVTVLLRDLREGKEGTVDQLFERVYEELRGIAGAHFRNQPRNLTLQPTALIHEAYIKLTGARTVAIRDRAHFFALASRVMRQILVDHCRRRLADKRGGSWVQVSLEGAPETDPQRSLDVLDLDDALGRLKELDARKSQVVELRFFGGLEVREAAEVLGVSHRTVENDWAFARAWLKRDLARSGGGAG